MKKFIDLFWNKPNYKNVSIFNQERFFEKGHFLISIFYFFVLFISFQSFTFNTQFPSWTDIINSENYFIPQWGSQWMTLLDWTFAVRLVFTNFLITAILGVIFWSSRTIRILIAIGLHQYLSLVSSFGYADHYLHMMSFATILFIFLPKKNGNTYKSDFLKVIFGLQTIILATYSISGFYKLIGIAKQLKWGVTSALSPTGMTLQSSKTSYFSGNEYFLQNYLIDYPGYWIAILQVLGIFIELFSIFVLFKIGMHRIWGLVLIIFHIAIAMTVGPDFSIHILTAGLFLLFSPFGSDKYDLVSDLRSLTKSKFKV